MKEYQKKWVEELNSCLTEKHDDESITEICKNIVSDDTGHTDELTQLLAKHILNILT